MIKRALLLLLLTAVWAFGSWWYYTCIIKGFCRTDGAFTSASDRAMTIVTTGTAAATVTTTALVSNEPSAPQTPAPITTSEFIDLDNDAISDEDERRIGTDPSADDSDEDGLKDNEELGADLQKPTDTDNDGIIDALDDDDDNDTILTAKEILLGTNPRNTDSDDDGLSDADETDNKIGTNPLLADTDNDGISDGTEVGSDPDQPIDTDKDGTIDALDEDDDNDGVLTAIEIQTNSDPLNQDSDGDGINDREELGDDPNNPKDTDGDGIADLIDSNPVNPALQAIDNAAAKSTQNIDTSSPSEQAASTESASEDQVTINATENMANDVNAFISIPIQKSRLYFPSRSSNPGLSDAAAKYFKGVAHWLNSSPLHTVVLTGHTDSIGKAKNNLNLGLKRAIEIKNMMVKLGANEPQIDVASMGETQPIASNKTESGRRQNRRVELIPALKP